MTFTGRRKRTPGGFNRYAPGAPLTLREGTFTSFSFLTDTPRGNALRDPWMMNRPSRDLTVKFFAFVSVAADSDRDALGQS